MLSPIDILRKKRFGKELTDEEIRAFANGVVDGSFTDYQAADMDKKISSIYNRLEKYLYVSFEGDEVIVELHENG